MWFRSTSSRAADGLSAASNHRLAEDFGIDFERGASREDDGALEDVLQLADVARPRIRHQPAHGRRVDAVEPPSDPRRELVEQELRQERNILGPLAERRELDREDAEAVVQVFAERLLADGLLAGRGWWRR